MIIGHDPMALNTMNSSGLWMALITPGRELKAVVDMKNSMS